jgi:hypothetical protein
MVRRFGHCKLDGILLIELSNSPFTNLSNRFGILAFDHLSPLSPSHYIFKDWLHDVINAAGIMHFFWCCIGLVWNHVYPQTLAWNLFDLDNACNHIGGESGKHFQRLAVILTGYCPVKKHSIKRGAMSEHRLMWFNAIDGNDRRLSAVPCAVDRNSVNDLVAGIGEVDATLHESKNNRRSG